MHQQIVPIVPSTFAAGGMDVCGAMFGGCRRLRAYFKGLLSTVSKPKGRFCVI